LPQFAGKEEHADLFLQEELFQVRKRADFSRWRLAVTRCEVAASSASSIEYSLRAARTPLR
jgi:hypothetical protein